MNSLNYVLFLFSISTILNSAISLFLWWKTKVHYYKSMSIMWLMGVLSLFTVGLTQQFSPIIQILGFSSIFLFSLTTSMTLSNVTKIHLKIFPFIQIYLAGILVSILLNFFFDIHPSLLAIPVCAAISFPLFYTGVRTIKYRWKDGSIPLRGFAISALAQGLHELDYPLSFYYPQITVLGFTFAITITFSLILFGLAFIVETVSKENTKLEMELSYKAVLSNHAKFAALGEMAAGVAHEVNNPLAAIQFSSQNIKYKLDRGQINDSNFFHKEVENIVKQVKHASFIVQSLLEFSQEIDNNSKEVVFIEDIIDKIIPLCKEKFKSNHVQLEIEFIDKNLKIYCHSHQISQLLLNMLNNSYEAVKNCEEKFVRVLISKNFNNKIEIKISDSGLGIVGEDGEKIFQPFFSTKTEVTGVGLGLSVAKGIVENHGGSIELLKNYRPTTFIITLPNYST